jgi:hypothetical protein
MGSCDVIARNVLCEVATPCSRRLLRGVYTEPVEVLATTCGKGQRAAGAAGGDWTGTIGPNADNSSAEGLKLMPGRPDGDTHCLPTWRPLSLDSEEHSMMKEVKRDGF